MGRGCTTRRPATWRRARVPRSRRSDRASPTPCVRPGRRISAWRRSESATRTDRSLGGGHGRAGARALRRRLGASQRVFTSPRHPCATSSRSTLSTGRRQRHESAHRSRGDSGEHERGAGVGELAVRRRSPSSLAKPGQQILSDAELHELFHVALTHEPAFGARQRRLAAGPAAPRAGARLRVSARRGRLARAEKGLHPPRFVIKQMRPLEPSPHVSAELRRRAHPRDVLSRARRIETLVVSGNGHRAHGAPRADQPRRRAGCGLRTAAAAGRPGVKLDGMPPRVFTHLGAALGEAARRHVGSRPQSGFALSRVDVRNATATLDFPDGRCGGCGCTARASYYAEPREYSELFAAAGRNRSNPRLRGGRSCAKAARCSC